jgi:DNA-binding transcriptional LysR family regulator
MRRSSEAQRAAIVADEVAELQLFVEIVKAGNLSAAARALNSSPAAMSRGLTALESRLGVRLVTRTSRSFELTEEGQLFYERCARIVADIADAEAEASSKGATIKGLLRPRRADGDWQTAGRSAHSRIQRKISGCSGSPCVV